MTRRTLDGMALGGMHDLVGGGFHRYSVDERWLVPHFEKMLYDNALLASLYLHAAKVFDDERYREIADRTVDYVLRELALDGGGFASAQDADTDGVEGLTFTWAPGEGAPEELLQPFEDGRFVLRGELDEPTRHRLHELRELRPKPARDDKAIASWNGLMLATLAQAGRLEPAVALAEFLLGPLSTPTDACTARGATESRRAPATSRTTRTSPTGCSSCTSQPAIRDGCASRTVSRRSPSSSSPTMRQAASSSHRQTASSSSPGRSRSTTTRRRAATRCSRTSCSGWRASGATTSSSAAAVSVLRLVRDALPKAPTAFGWLLVALDQYLAPHRELAIIGAPDDEVARVAIARASADRRRRLRPGRRHPVARRPQEVDGLPTLYACRDFACDLPVTELD